MLLMLYFVRAVVTALIFSFVGLAFLPHFLGSRLTGLQKLLTAEIVRREGGQS